MDIDKDNDDKNPQNTNKSKTDDLEDGKDDTKDNVNENKDKEVKDQKDDDQSNTKGMFWWILTEYWLNIHFVCKFYE